MVIIIFYAVCFVRTLTHERRGVFFLTLVASHVRLPHNRFISIIFFFNSPYVVYYRSFFDFSNSTIKNNTFQSVPQLCFVSPGAKNNYQDSPSLKNDITITNFFFYQWFRQCWASFALSLIIMLMCLSYVSETPILFLVVYISFFLRL